MEKYQKRMIEEFKLLNERTTKLEHFLDAPEMEEKRAELSEKMLSAMHCQYSGMVVYRSNLADRLIMLGLAEHVFEYPELKVGEEFETEDGKFRCIGHEENGCPVCEIIEADGQQEAMSHEDEVVADKQLRKDIDQHIQQVKALPASRERSLAVTKLQEAVMWLGMDLKRLGTPNPYPSSKDPGTGATVEPTADGLKL